MTPTQFMNLEHHPFRLTADEAGWRLGFNRDEMRVISSPEIVARIRIAAEANTRLTPKTVCASSAPPRRIARSSTPKSRCTSAKPTKFGSIEPSDRSGFIGV